MCDTISCQRSHQLISKCHNSNIILSFKEFKLVLCCLAEERNVCCNSCGKCDECKKALYFVDTLQKMEWLIRQTPNQCIRMVEFNKQRSILELYYDKTYKNFEDAFKDNVFIS